MDEPRAIPTAPESAIIAFRTLPLAERLLGLYGYGVEGCAQRSKEQVAAVIEELIGLLNFDCGELAQAFHRLYAFCLARSREDRFDQVAWVLRELHDLCERVFATGAAAALPALPAPPAASRPGSAAPRPERGPQPSRSQNAGDSGAGP